MGQLGLERLEVGVGREVVLGLGPAGDGQDDPIDQLADARLALRRADVAAEVLADDDVRGELRPEARDLDVLLLEDELARLVADGGGPGLPRDLVVGMDARRGPAALEGEAGGALAVTVGAVEAGALRAAQRAGCSGRVGAGGLLRLRRACVAVHHRGRVAALSGHVVGSSTCVCRVARGLAPGRSLRVAGAAAVAATPSVCRSFRGAVPGPCRPTGSAGGRVSGAARSDQREVPEYAAGWGQSRPKTQDVVVARVDRPQHVVPSVVVPRPRSVNGSGGVAHGSVPVVHVPWLGCARAGWRLSTSIVSNRRSVCAARSSPPTLRPTVTRGLVWRDVWSQPSGPRTGFSGSALERGQKPPDQSAGDQWPKKLPVAGG